MIRPMLVLLIISLGPTGPAVSEATADSNSGYGSVKSEKRVFYERYNI